ncbi:MAG: hypothetical protein ACR2RV_08390 [Verrucomicrobiales bacterium]
MSLYLQHVLNRIVATKERPHVHDAPPKSEQVFPSCIRTSTFEKERNPDVED